MQVWEKRCHSLINYNALSAIERRADRVMRVRICQCFIQLTDLGKPWDLPASGPPLLCSHSQIASPSASPCSSRMLRYFTYLFAHTWGSFRTLPAIAGRTLHAFRNIQGASQTLCCDTIKEPFSVTSSHVHWRKRCLVPSYPSTAWWSTEKLGPPSDYTHTLLSLNLFDNPMPHRRTSEISPLTETCHGLVQPWKALACLEIVASGPWQVFCSSQWYSELYARTSIRPVIRIWLKLYQIYKLWYVVECYCHIFWEPTLT